MTKKSTTTGIDEKVLASLVPKKTFSYHQGGTITSLDYDDSGQYLLSSGIDKSIQMYDVHKGIHHKQIPSQKYGCHLARFVHKELNCLYVSTPEVEGGDVDENALRYVSLADKKYIRYFRGHHNQVVNLEVNPVSDTFITSSIDHTIKLWDLRTPSCTGNISTNNRLNFITYDPHGIFFVSCSQNSSTITVNFYDLKNYIYKPFLTSQVETTSLLVSVEMANNGKYLLVSTAQDHYLIDAFNGSLLAILRSSAIVSQYPFKSTCFSPCGKYVIAGTDELLIFDLSSVKPSSGSGKTTESSILLPVKTIPTNQGIPRLLAFNPKLLSLATADNTVSLWQPLSES